MVMPLSISSAPESMLCAMKKAAETILVNHRALEADEMLMPFKDIITLIDEL